MMLHLTFVMVCERIYKMSRGSKAVDAVLKTET